MEEIGYDDIFSKPANNENSSAMMNVSRDANKSAFLEDDVPKSQPNTSGSNFINAWWDDCINLCTFH